MLIARGPFQELVSPPTMAVSKISAACFIPLKSCWASCFPPFLGSAKLTKAARGMPAMAAISLKLTFMALRPILSAPASAKIKQLPSSSMSEVTRHGLSLGQVTTAVSSPGPTGTQSLGVAWVLSQEINSSSALSPMVNNPLTINS